MIKKKYTMDELHNKMVEIEERVKKNQTQRSEDISRIPFQDRLIYNRDSNSLYGRGLSHQPPTTVTHIEEDHLICGVDKN